MTKAADIRAALRRYFSSQEWAVMFEVADATGARHTRVADAVAMNLWPSRGLAIHGIEIKVSRHDWQRELKQPAKAEAVAQYCDYWWVAAPPGVVQHGELPMTWGVLEYRDGAIKVAHKAATVPAKPIDRRFVAAMLRRAGGAAEDDIEAIIKERVAAAEAGIKQRIEMAVNARMSGNEAAARVLARVHELTGQDSKWIPTEDEALAIAAVIKSGVTRQWGALRGLPQMLRKITEKIEAVLEEMNVPPGDDSDALEFHLRPLTKEKH